MQHGVSFVNDSKYMKSFEVKVILIQLKKMEVPSFSNDTLSIIDRNSPFISGASSFHNRFDANLSEYCFTLDRY